MRFPKFPATIRYGLSPEENLVFAIYLQALRDLFCEFEKWRLDAMEFLIKEGFSFKDIEKMKEVWQDD